jgi:transcriptional regulator GlxA family with amidase domain
MKEKEIKVDAKAHEVVLFVEKEDEQYAPVQSGSFIVENYLDDFLEKKKNLEQQLREELQKGAISPVYFYMILQDMGPGDLAKRVGISQRKLKKHFRPEVFAKLNEKMLAKYSEIFGVESLGRRA